MSPIHESGGQDLDVGAIPVGAVLQRSGSNIVGVATWINVKDPAYGAVGDGSNDDTAEVQAALDAANTAGGGIVYFPAGTYLCTTLTTYSKVRMVGAGQRVSTLKLKNGTNADFIRSFDFAALTGTNSNGGVYLVGFEDLTIDGNKANNTSGRGVALYGYCPQFSNVEITNCKGIGLYSEWGDTAAVSSDTLVNGNMEGKAVNLYVHRNEGGGIDWYGPSDSKFLNCDVAKNGPTSSTTTVGLKVRGNAYSCVFTNCHVWGGIHKYAWQLDVPAILNGCQGEGAITGQCWLRNSGNVIVGGRFFTGGTTGDPPGFIIGDNAGSLFSGENYIATKLTSCGINFDKDAGDSTYILQVYWPDTSKTVVTGTQQSAKSNRWNLKINPTFGGRAARGTMAAVAEEATFRRPIYGHGHPTGTIGASIFDRSTVVKADITTPPTSGTLFLVRCEVIPGETITNINVSSGTTAGASLTHRWAALYDTALAKLGVSADDTSASWAASTPQAYALTTAYVVPQGVYAVYAGLVVVGTTVPSLIGNSFLPTAISALAPVHTHSCNASLTDPASAPATATPSSQSTKVPCVWLT